MFNRTLKTILTFVALVVLALLIFTALGNIGQAEMILILGVAVIAAAVAWFATGRSKKPSTQQDEPQQ